MKIKVGTLSISINEDAAIKKTKADFVNGTLKALSHTNTDKEALKAALDDAYDRIKKPKANQDKNAGESPETP